MQVRDESQWLHDRQGYIDADPERGKMVIEAVEKWLDKAETLAESDDEYKDYDLHDLGPLTMHELMEEAFPFLETRDNFDVYMLCEVLFLVVAHWKYAEAYTNSWSGFEKMLYHSVITEKMAIQAQMAQEAMNDD